MMRDITRKLYILTILSLGTQPINLPGVELTIFQYLLILSGIFSIITICKYKIKFHFNNIMFTFIEVISCFIAFMVSTSSSWAKSSLLVGLMTSMMIFFIPQFFSKDDLDLLQRSLIRSQYIAIPFSIYTYYAHYYLGGLPDRLNLFLDGMYIDLDSDFIDRMKASGEVRVALPFASPPVLSSVMAICIVILLLNKNLFRKSIRILLICSYSIILIFTGSRTGMFGLVIAYVFLFIKNRRIHLRLSSMVLGIMSSVIVLILAYKKFDYMLMFISRFSLEYLSNDRHFLILKEGIRILNSSFQNILLGIGFGSSINLVWIYTTAAPYFFNSYLTLIVERGVLGICLVFFLCSIYIHIVKSKKYFSVGEYSMSIATLVALSSCFVYELFHCYFVVMVLAVYYIIFNNDTHMLNFAKIT